MYLLWNYMLEKLPPFLHERLNNQLRECERPNPNSCYQEAAKKTLIEVAREKPIDSIKDLLTIATLTCVLTQKMQADKELISILKSINHPFVQAFAAYFEENPANYTEALLKIEQHVSELEKRDDYTIEQKALIFVIQSWVYGQKGDITVLKQIHKEIKELIDDFETNPIVQYGLQDAFLNVVWWYLHFGVDADVRGLLKFIEPYVLKNKFYKTYTTFLNVKGAVESFLGDNVSAKESFQQLVEVHSKYNDTYRLSIAIGNLAEVYVAMGRIQEAKDMMEKAIQMYKESTGQWPYLYLVEIGNIYYVLDDPRAEEYFLQAYEIQKKEVSMHKAFILYEIVHYYLRKENLAKANDYLKELQELAKVLEVPSISARVDYLRGFYEILKYNLANGVSYLQSALKQAQITKDMEILQFCNIQLATAYLLYYKFRSKEEYLNNSLNYIEAVSQIAQENHHSQALVTSSFIRTIIEAIRGNLDEADSQLEQLMQNQELDLSFFEQDIKKIQNAIQAARTSGELRLSLATALEYIVPQFRNLLSFKMEQKQPKKAEVLGVLVISETGIPVYSKIASKLKTDDLLLSGLLMAINQLANSIVEGPGRLREVNYAKFAITLQSIKNGMIAVIATEITANIRVWALSLAERLKEIPTVVTSYINNIPEKIKDLLEQMELK
ncbi:MAG: tetratricopeptide repeat protein [Candidatus Heimdallarchaeaceae archaeon]